MSLTNEAKTAQMTNRVLAYHSGAIMTFPPRRVAGSIEPLCPVRAHVVIEPGDHTRYDLALVQLLDGSIVATRLVGGYPKGSATFYKEMSSFALREGAEALGGGNEWSAVLLGWWMWRLLVSHGAPERA